MHFNKLPNYILILVLGLAGFGIYINSLRGEFLIDDYSAIINNPAIHDCNIYFSRHFRIRPGILAELRRVFIWHIAGDNPFAYHLCNVLTHVSCVILLFILINLLFNNKSLSFLTSLIFAIHPIHTEAVSWISGGHYALSGLFFMAAFIFYVKSARSIFNLSLLVIFLALCLLAGEAVVMLPVIFIVYDIFFREKLKEGRVWAGYRLIVLSSLLLISGMFIALNFVTRNKFVHSIFYFRGASYLIVIAKALLYYLKLLYLPIQRGLYHTFAYNTLDSGKISPAFFGSIAVIIISVFLFFRCRKNAKPISFGIAWFFITYLPYSNIVPVCNIISERYMYLPSAGFALLMAYLFLKIWKVINENLTYKAILRASAIIALVLFLGSYCILTLKHNIQYSNIITYWQTNINNFPDGYKAYNNLAGTYYAMGNRQQAIAYCWVNLMIKPDQPHVWCNLGKVYRETGELEWARYCYEEALRVDKGFLPAVSGLEAVKKELLKK